MFSKWVLCYFACLIGLDVPLLQIQMHCFKANRTTDITLHEVKRLFSSYFVKYSPYRKMFQIKVVNLNEIYFSCHVPILCTRSHFRRKSVWSSAWGVTLDRYGARIKFAYQFFFVWASQV